MYTAQPWPKTDKNFFSQLYQKDIGRATEKSVMETTMNMSENTERQLILTKYESLMDACRLRGFSDKNLEEVRKAFEFAYNSHKGAKRKSGEPFVIHPIVVAQIVVLEIGLGSTAAVAALLHDVVEDTDYSVEDIKNLFSDKVAYIVDGLTKIDSAFIHSKDYTVSVQAENFRKILLTISEDIRVVLIKLADRLHNLRTIGSMPPGSQNRSASETMYLYAPLAHRLGLYKIKTELEDLSFKIQQPRRYEKIVEKLKDDERKRQQLINKLSLPISNKLMDENFDFIIEGRPKSIFSIHKKMEEKKVSFEEIYDKLALRIIFNPKDEYKGIPQCWQIYGIISKIYKPVPGRLRDWLNKPKPNGYTALHATLMGPDGNFLEVQIRTKIMNDVAENGVAAHYTYKGLEYQPNHLDKLIEQVREHLENPAANALDFLDEFKMNVFSPEIDVFTPRGDMIKLPAGSTVLDFAFAIHTELGLTAIAGKVNSKLEGLSYKIHSGDQVEIIHSPKTEPKEGYMDFVRTTRAKTNLRNKFKKQRKAYIQKGTEKLEKRLERSGLRLNANIIRKLKAYYKAENKDDLFEQIGNGTIELKNLKDILRKSSSNPFIKYWRLQFTSLLGNNNKKVKGAELKKSIFDRKKVLKLNDNFNLDDFILAQCCQPIPGDEVIAYNNPSGKMIIHKTSCPNAIKLGSSHSDMIMKVQWKTHKMKSFLSRITIEGIDKQGIIANVTGLISKDLDVNMRAISVRSHDGVFDGEIELFVHSIEHLNSLILRLSDIDGMKSVNRIDKENNNQGQHSQKFESS